ncbi:hypothetical protein KDAU_69760 [Dictyobacter aurantiacus]|uniref:Uncharacterized protein n=1 Tax=Dictyobacter aurantiacus TaxID=1936993 RepID=A0A401ZRZ0_9CHLR|nr:hypothetical protein KDAU_69760 [Dictyobacter aurantiacus]
MVGAGAKGINEGIAIARTIRGVTGTGIMIETAIGMKRDLIAVDESTHMSASMTGTVSMNALAAMQVSNLIGNIRAGSDCGLIPLFVILHGGEDG